MSDPIATDRPGTGATERGLVAVVVEYDDRPNQCTVYPADADGVTRMSSWISADVDCFVDCETMR